MLIKTLDVRVKLEVSTSASHTGNLALPNPFLPGSKHCFRDKAVDL